MPEPVATVEATPMEVTTKATKAGKATKAAAKTAKPKVTKAAAKPTEAAAKPTEAVAKATEAVAKPTEAAAKPAKSPKAKAAKPAKPTDATAKPAEATGKAAAKPAKPTEATGKAAAKADKPAKANAKATGKATAKADKPAAAPAPKQESGKKRKAEEVVSENKQKKEAAPKKKTSSHKTVYVRFENFPNNKTEQDAKEMFGDLKTHITAIHFEPSFYQTGVTLTKPVSGVATFDSQDNADKAVSQGKFTVAGQTVSLRYWEPTTPNSVRVNNQGLTEEFLKQKFPTCQQVNVKPHYGRAFVTFKDEVTANKAVASLSEEDNKKLRPVVASKLMLNGVEFYLYDGKRNKN